MGHSPGEPVLPQRSLGRRFGRANHWRPRRSRDRVSNVRSPSRLPFHGFPSAAVRRNADAIAAIIPMGSDAGGVADCHRASFLSCRGRLENPPPPVGSRPTFDTSSSVNSRTDTPISDPAPNARNTSHPRSRSRVCADAKETRGHHSANADHGADGRSPFSKSHDFLPQL